MKPLLLRPVRRKELILDEEGSQKGGRTRESG